MNAGKFVQVNLVADTAAGNAAAIDPNLVNPWGISASASSPFWLSDNGTGKSTIYKNGVTQGFVVAIPASGGAANGPVTGQVFNGTTDFAVGGAASHFIFDSEDGVVSAWTGGTAATVVADRSATGAVYKGLAMATSNGANFLYATNFNSGKVDVFDKSFTLTSSFTDSTLPANYAPFGIANFNGQLFVTFALQDAAKRNDVQGPGNGFVDVFNPDGTLAHRLVSNGHLNSPWGLAVAPTGFGNVGGALLVGNLGDGWINAYDPVTGQFKGSLSDSGGSPIAIDGLWGLMFGNGGSAGSASTLFFTAGPQHETHGLFGSLTVAP